MDIADNFVVFCAAGKKERKKDKGKPSEKRAFIRKKLKCSQMRQNPRYPRMHLSQREKIFFARVCYNMLIDALAMVFHALIGEKSNQDFWEEVRRYGIVTLYANCSFFLCKQ